MAEPKMPEKLGRYEVVRELGKGAMGIVYEGKDPNIGRRVAIKTARREVVEASGMADEMMERFLREAQAAGALNHPNIITIYDAAEEDGIAYIAMEYLEGGDLGDVIDSKRKLGMDEIVEIGASICEALDVAHANGVVHRDIKPANILMPTGQALKVADFGIAHVSDSNLTQDGALIGTPHYMSPEQFMGQKLDGRSDLFSVGNILYELTTGEKPFGGEALSTVMHHVIKTDPVNPTELNFNVPDALAQVIMTALSKRPAARYGSGNAMAAALRESLKEHPDPAKLSPSSAVLSATVTGTAPTAQGATVVGGTPPVDATLPGGAPGALESTVAGTPPAVEATLPGGAPAAPSATVAGGGPAPETPEQLASTIPGATLDPTPAAATAGPNKGILFGGIAAALVVVIGAVMVLSGGSSDTPTAGTTPPDMGTPEGNGTVPAPADAPYFASIQLDIWRAPNDEIMKKHDRNNIPMRDLGPLDPVDAIDLTVTDGENNVLYEGKGVSADTLFKFPADARPDKLQVNIMLDGMNKTISIDSPAVPGDSALPQSILLPPLLSGS